MKKLLSLMLSLLMVLSVVPAFAISVSAEYAEDTVAVIGTTEYKTLFGEDGALSNTESVLAGATKDVVTLVKDVKETGSATLKSDAVLDLAGHEIINYSTETVIDTNGYKLHIKNTAYQETNARAKFGYSGTLLSTKANVTMEDVHFYEKNVFPEYNAEVNMLDGVSWCAGMYWRDSKHKDLTNYDYQMGYTASGTKISDGVYEKQFIEVEYGKSYYTYCSTTLADSFAVTLIGFNESDTPIVNYGKTNVVTIADESVVKVGINVYCTNEWKDTYKYGKLATCISKGEVTPYMHEITDLCKTVVSANAFVNFTNSTPITWTMDNCVYNQTSGTASILNLTKPVKFDFWDSTFSFANFNGKNSFTINNASSSGGIYNCTFSGNNAQSVIINSTSSEGLVLQNCTITTSGDSRTALTISGGKVTLADGTMGSTGASNNTNISGGDVTIIGTKFNGSKSNGYVLNISTSAVVTISKATIVKGGTTIKNTTTFLNSLAEGIALYKAATLTVENILSRTAALNTLSTFYVDECEHFCTAAQNGSKVCAYCEGEVTSIYHDYSSFKYDATHHWGVCARCDEVQAKNEHTVGTAGTAATCTEEAVCGTCNQKFGEPLGHSFTDYQPVSIAIAGCEHNPVTKAVCDNGCGEEKYDYSALVNLKVTKEAVAPDCVTEGSTEEKSCTECQKVIAPAEVVDALGHDFGEVEVIEDSNYAYAGKGKRTCLRDNCGFSEEVVIPVKEFKGSTVAIIGDYTVEGTTQYSNLAAAFAAADEDDVVILVKATSIDKAITLTKKATLDLNGKQLTVATEASAIVTNYDFELRNTNDGLGKVQFGLTEVLPSDPDDKYGTIADVGNPAYYVPGHYSTSGVFEANTNRIANKKLLAVEYGKSYTLNTGSTNSKLEFIIREYDKNGKFVASKGGLVNGTVYTPSKETVAYVSVAFWINGDTSTNIGAMLNNGAFTPTITTAPTKTTVAFSKPFINTTATFKMSNIKAVSSANTSFVYTSATDVNAPAKFVAKDCDFAASGNAVPLKFTSGAIEFNVSDSSIRSTTGGGFEVSSATAFGTLKNTKITKNSGAAFTISKSAASGITFDGCNVSQGAWDSTASAMSGGTVILTGGTVISGSNVSSTVLNVSGGKLIINEATLNGDKGTDTSRRLLYITNSPTIEIIKANFNTGTANGAKGLITNNWTKLLASIQKGSWIYETSEKNGEFIYSRDTDFTVFRNLYVNLCDHYETTATCSEAGECVYCAAEIEALGCDDLGFGSNDEVHWKQCSRCGTKVEGTDEAHTEGSAATCTTAKRCAVCRDYYGESLGHDYTVTGHDEKDHWTECSRCQEEQEGTRVAHAGGEAKCYAFAVCDSCGFEYGEKPDHVWGEYKQLTAPDCDNNATERAFCTNEGCTEHDTREVPNTKRAHNEVIIDEIPATCTSTGWSEWSYCSHCDAIIKSKQILPQLSYHTWDEGRLDGVDCEHSDLIYTCVGCGITQSVDIDDSVDNHTIKVTSKASTYFATGYKNRKTCTVCGKVVAKGTTVAKKVLKTPTVKYTAVKGKKIKVKYSKVTGATGFQVRYKVKGAKKWTIKKFNSTKAKTVYLTKLKAGKKYYVQTRAFVKSGSKTAYSKWSKQKTLTAKK